MIAPNGHKTPQVVCVFFFFFAVVVAYAAHLSEGGSY